MNLATSISNEDHMKSINGAIQKVSQEWDSDYDLTTKLELSASMLNMVTSFSINDLNKNDFISFYFDNTNELTDNANIGHKLNEYKKVIHNVDDVKKNPGLVKDKITNIPFEQINDLCKRLYTLTEVTVPDICVDITKDDSYEDLAKDIITFAYILNCDIFEKGIEKEVSK